MSKKGDMRVNCIFERDGTYCAQVEVYLGWGGGWKAVKKVHAGGLRSPVDALELAKKWKEENSNISVGVVE